ncbi:hypothetical protein O1611_g8282 [Lasiodiplodia mahajangana]|uniref:Uncharacterized protein n=1 Tax=Lasiodiplodia mahajangana TaxID=1108764 RepID=A0ACC2JD04_9PEZI|nr:hypothetical protein O1611_g8282 [Lasiodiplodia mahajangana]
MRRTRSNSVGERLEDGTAGRDSRNKSVSEASPSRQIKAGEAMTRSGSGSGGIRLDEETVVEFGSPPAQTAAAIAEVRRKSPRIGRTSPLAAQPFSPPRANSRSPPSANGSPPRGGVGLGIQH